MTRVLYWSMYVTSAAIGYMIGGFLLLIGWRFATPIGQQVREQAREHAEQAARREGPYLASITFVVSLAGIVAFGSWLIGLLS